MPGSMDGLKLAHYIRNRWPPIQIIVASGEMIVAQGALPLGVPFFAKPYRDHFVAATLKRMIAGGAAAQ
jgi:CheY-like chemotaxis protein